MKLKTFLFVLPFLLIYCQKTNQENHLIATVGNRQITASEFKDRANFNPVIGNPSTAQYKKQILQSIIAEALLAQKKNSDEPEILTALVDQKNREAVIEQLWDEVIFKDIQVDDSTLWDFYLKSNIKRAVEYAVFNDFSNAKIFQEAWKGNNPKAINILQIDSISFSGNIAVLEKEVFKGSIGQISDPVKMGRRYLVYKPVREWSNKVLSQGEFHKDRKSIKKQYLKFEKQKRFLSYVEDNFEKNSYQLDKSQFKKLTQSLEKDLNGKTDLNNSNIEFFESAIIAKEQNSSKAFVVFTDDETWTKEKFLRRLAASPYPLNYSSNDAFRYSIIRAAKRILDDELLYRKGLSYGFDKSNYVKWQTEMWQDYYSAQTIAAQLRSPNQLKTVLDSLKENTSIKVNWSDLDSLTLNVTKMIVLKSHFPGQPIVPKYTNWGLQLEKK